MVKTGPFSFHELVWDGHSLRQAQGRLSPLAFDFDRGDRDLILNLILTGKGTASRARPVFAAAPSEAEGEAEGCRKRPTQINQAPAAEGPRPA